MAIGATDSRHYKNIANAIRSASFGDIEGPIAPAQFASCIAEISGISHREGIKSEYDRFWDAYQGKGERVSYNQAFASGGWTSETFTPKYDIVVHNANRMFSYCGVSGSLKSILRKCGITMTMHTTVINISNMFEYASGITEIGVLNFRALTRLDCTTVFTGCKSLVTIEKIILPAGQTTFSNWFNGCTALENVIFEGTIGANNLNVSACTKLTRDSLMSIINCLADNSSTGTTMTVTLGTDNLAKLTDAEKAIATQKGWSLI